MKRWLAISALAASAFVLLTRVVARSTSLIQADAAVLAWTRAHRTPVIDTGFITLSAIGSPLGVTLMGMAVGLVLIRERRWTLLTGWTISLGGGGLLNLTIKELLQRERPVHQAGLLFRTSWSYPSGHSMGSVIGFGLLAWLVSRNGFPIPRRRLMLIAALVLIALVAVSRLYLGVHYLTDVMGGLLLGTAWLALSIGVLQRVGDTGD